MSIEIKNVFFTYEESSKRKVDALKNISLTIHNGEFVGIMGQTGCGKSTLIQLIAGLLKPSKGEIKIDNANINDKNYNRAVLREQVGIVFQYPEYQLFETTVEKDVAFALKHRTINKKEKEARVKWALEMMGFSYEEMKDKSPLSLSGGEKRRVAIAGVLVSKPRILIFDEPIAGLDPYSRIEFLNLTKELNRQGTTIIIVSHNVDVLCEYADRIIVLNDGYIVADGAPNKIFHNIDIQKKYHIGISDARYIAQGLYDNGILKSPVITTYKELLEQIKDSLKDGDKK